MPTSKRVIFFIFIPPENRSAQRRDNGGNTVLGISHGRSIVRALAILVKLRNRDGSQNSDDRNNDHQLDQGKDFLFLERLHGQAPSVVKVSDLSMTKQMACQLDRTGRTRDSLPLTTHKPVPSAAATDVFCQARLPHLGLT